MNNISELHDTLDQLANIAQAVEDGELDALKAFVWVKKIEDTAKEVKRDIQESAISEAEKYPEKTFEAHGAKISKIAGKANYSFKHIAAWTDAERRKKEIETQAKQALQAAQQGRNIVDPETGELAETAEVKYSADTISVKLL